MHGGGRVAEAGETVVGQSASALPVVDLYAGDAGFVGEDKDALWGEGSMDDAFAVGVADGIGDLAEEFEPG